MTITLLLVFGCYFIFVLGLLYGWEISQSQTVEDLPNQHSIAITIPFRNEENNLESLLQSLSALNYPVELKEIILVNDHSTDHSLEVLSRSEVGFTLVHLNDNEQGKKAALTKGIETATSDIIVTSDADCTYPMDWLKSINSAFSDINTQMVFGAVAITGSKSFFTKMQTIEFASLIGSGASLLQWKIPAMANGANLAFRREAFFKVRGYEGNEFLASGDDEFLLKKIYQAFPRGVLFNNLPHSVVSTAPQISMRSFMQQRIRWASKWRYQTNGKVKFIGALVFLFQIAFIVSLYLAIEGRHQLAYTLLLSKAVLEGIFLSRVCQFLGVKIDFLAFLALQIFYPYYVAFTAIQSLFSSFEWKGRKSH